VSELSPGQVLRGKWCVKRLAAQGGTSRIYEGYPVAGAGMVAIKQMLPVSDAEEFKEFMAAFSHEYSLLSSLDHPNMARALDFFEESGETYLVEEFVHGQTLEDRMLAAGGRLMWQDAVRIFRDILSVLGYLHERDVIYRDMKPSNVIVQPSGTVRLVDFGAARKWKHGKVRDTVPLGTPGFASPESYGHNQTDARSDIYSAGVLLHYMLTGLEPKLENAWIFSEPHALHPEIPLAVSDTVMRAVRVKAEERFQTVDDMRRALDGQKVAPPPPPGRASTLTHLRQRLAFVRVGEYYAGAESFSAELVGLGFLTMLEPLLWAGATFLGEIYAAVNGGVGVYTFAYPCWNWWRWNDMIVEIYDEGLRYERGKVNNSLLWFEITSMTMYHDGDTVLRGFPGGRPSGGFGTEIVLPRGWPGKRRVEEATLQEAGLHKKSQRGNLAGPEIYVR
jgi:hypothetical protein